ncbi:IMPACT family protein [Mobilicoccus caccae]|uniref:YigZ family protein n=1 Tax=Mobilicoccus caccae TaxID=1859295 RepID=A0ABQ6IVZ0_9MICO|nr:YigZ family protein [Mobilicoccus caccae]GMA41458.1 YigZ family protein [Mobilicoccus caccae]
MSVWLPQGYREVSELEVKRSRFLTTVARVEDEAGAREVVAEVRRTWPDARHHCTAFIVEMPGAQPVERSSDDGEPSGTAGRPMLDVLRGAGLAQVVAVVTRYFGGVKLGTGGLVRAYSDAVSLAIDGAPRVRPVVSSVSEVTFSYADAARAQDAFAAHGLRVLDSEYGEAVTLRVAGDGELLRGLAAEIVREDVAIEPRGEHLVEEPEPPASA